MNKLLKFQIILLILLVVTTIFVRMGLVEETPVATDPILEGQDPTIHTDPTETQPQQTEPAPTETEPTESTAPTEPLDKEIVLTFGEDFSVESRDYFIYDCDEEKILVVEGGLDDKLYPASITKLFTAYVALQYLDPNQVITLGKEVNLVAANSSLAYVKPGQTIKVSELIKGMLLPSGNDAAYGLAAATARQYSGNANMAPGEAVKYFVNLMNTTAQKLGMTGTHFANPDGIHDFEHYTSSRDMMKIAQLALESYTIRNCVSIVSDRVTFSNGDVAVWDNTNKLIDPTSQYYCPDAIGLKTGHTSYAGFCLLSAFELEGKTYVVGTLGCVRPEDRFIDALKLYNVLVAAVKG